MQASLTANRKLRLSLGLEHHAEKRFDDAAKIYQQLHAEDTRDSEVLFLLGVLSCDLGLYDHAVRFLNEALAISPNFPEAKQQLAVALSRQAAVVDLSSAALSEAEPAGTVGVN